jgi:hypothetical protein
MRLAASLALLCVGACASTSPGPTVPSFSVGSGYSGIASEPSRQFDTTGIGMSGGLDAGLVTRPDALVMEVRIRKENARAAEALAQAQAAATELTARLQQVTAGAAAFTPCGTQVTPVGGRSKTAAPAGAGAFLVVIEGRIEVALAPTLDYWQRSALLVGLAELTDRYAAANDAKTADQGVSLTNSHVVVKNPESFRAKLTEQWVQRARGFAAAAQAHEAPLVLLDCAPPGEIVQKQRSFEEVALSLSVSCRLGSVKAAAATPPAAAR